MEDCDHTLPDNSCEKRKSSVIKLSYQHHDPNQHKPTCCKVRIANQQNFSFHFQHTPNTAQFLSHVFLTLAHTSTVT